MLGEFLLLQFCVSLKNSSCLGSVVMLSQPLLWSLRGVANLMAQSSPLGCLSHLRTHSDLLPIVMSPNRQCDIDERTAKETNRNPEIIVQDLHFFFDRGKAIEQRNKWCGNIWAFICKIIIVIIIIIIIKILNID